MSYSADTRTASHLPDAPSSSAERAYALVGNPNVGKSVIFGMLTGKYVNVSNFPGTTVEVARGEIRTADGNAPIIDTPGANSLLPRSEDERVARDILLDTENTAVIQVADAKNLSRALFLTSQIAEMGLPQVLALNMWDESLDRGLDIDTQGLSDLTGIPIVKTIATQRYGKKPLLDALPASAKANLRVDYGDHIEGALVGLELLLPETRVSKRALGLMLLAGDNALESTLSERFPEFDREPVAEIRARVQSHYSEPLSYVISLKRQRQMEDIANRFMSRTSALRKSAPWVRYGFFFFVAPILSLAIGWVCASLVSSFIPQVNNFWFHGAGALASFGLAMHRLFGREFATQRRVSEVLGNIALDPVAGLPVLIITLYLIYLFVGVFAAGTCVDFIESKFFGSYSVPFGQVEPTISVTVAEDDMSRLMIDGVGKEGLDDLELVLTGAVQADPNFKFTDLAVGNGSLSFMVPTKVSAKASSLARETFVSKGWLIPLLSKASRSLIPSQFVNDLLFGSYGLISVGLTYAIAIVLPIVGFFFLAFSLLEDSGYLPRLAVLANRSFRKMGMNGKAVLPMVLGLGCDTMATLTTRILDTKKERFIAVLLLALAVPCSAQLGVILGLLGGVSAGATLLFIGVVASQILLIGWLCGKYYPGERSDFLIEIPPFRFPSLKNVAFKTFHRLRWFLKEAVPFFLLGTLVLFILDRIQVLSLIERGMSPIVQQWLGLPAKSTEAFIMGFLRRDYGAAGFFILFQRGMLNTRQVIVSITVLTLFVPCIANFFVMMKEQGVRRAVLMVAFIFPFAMFIGGLLNWALIYLGWFGGAV